MSLVAINIWWEGINNLNLSSIQIIYLLKNKGVIIMVNNS